MSDTTDINGIPYPELVDEPNIEQAVKPLAEHIDTRIIPRFATTSERDGAIVAPAEGMVCHVETHGLMLYGPASAWVPMAGMEFLSLSRTTTQPIPSGTDTPISFSAEPYDPFGIWAVATNPTRIVPPFPGRWEVKGAVSMNVTALTAYILKNGASPSGILLGSQTRAGAPTGTTSIRTEGSTTFNGTTDYVEIMVGQSSGSSQNTLTGHDGILPTARLIYRGPAYI